MSIYADTNFLVRLFLELPDAEASLQPARGRGIDGGAAFPITWLHRIEICNAIQLYVFRRDARNRVSPEHGGAVWASFRDELSGAGRLRLAPIATADLEHQFEELSLRHTAKGSFRTYDLLHVASALLLKCDTFWSFDEKASRLAVLEGLKLRRT